MSVTTVRGMVRSTRLLSAVALFGCHSDGIAGVSGSFRPGTAAHDVAVGQSTRRYLLHVPAKRPINVSGVVRAYSLVIVLHGSSGSADEIRQTTKMDAQSEADRFLVAYPEGVKGAGGLFPSDWNAGTCCGAAGRENIDDVGFISAMIVEIGKKVTVDPKRVYVVGFSDGGRMAHHLACKIAPTLAAIAVVSGSLKDKSCKPSRPVPLLGVHGTSDAQVPYDEAALTPPPTAVTGVAATLPASIQFWVAVNGCKAGTKNRLSKGVVQATFTGCTGGAVSFYTIEGGSHAWPGDPGGAGSQPPMSELKATTVIGQFFARQLRR